MPLKRKETKKKAFKGSNVNVSMIQNLELLSIAQ